MRKVFFIYLLFSSFLTVAQVKGEWESSPEKYFSFFQKKESVVFLNEPTKGESVFTDEVLVRHNFFDKEIGQANISANRVETFLSTERGIIAQEASWFIGALLFFGGLVSFLNRRRGVLGKLLVVGALFFSDFVKAQSVQGLVPNQGITTEGVIRGALGMLVLVFIAYIFSSNRKAINWRTTLTGLGLQLFLAVGVLKIEAVRWFFEVMGGFFVLILDFTKKGSEFVFGGLVDVNGGVGYVFAFQVLPTIIFFSALTSILFYYGIIQVVMRGLAWGLSKLLGISGAESLSVAGNVFLGQTEAPLMIKSYLPQMTKSEILLVMTGGMATVAGGVLASYINFLGGNDPVQQIAFAKHLLAASVMAAPGAVVVSKILYPQDEKYENNYKTSDEQFGANILDVISNGTTDGLKLAANVGAMLLVFVAMIAMCNHVLGWIGEITSLNDFIATHTPYKSFSIEMVLGTLFSPVMWIIGVAKEDVMLMGQILGIKLAASEFVGYIQLAELKDLASATHFTYEKSVIMATYMLCGFANFASIGIQIGGIGSLAPSQRTTLSEFGLRSVLGGTLASLLSATMAGMIIG